MVRILLLNRQVDYKHFCLRLLLKVVVRFMFHKICGVTANVTIFFGYKYSRDVGNKKKNKIQ